MGGGGMGIRPGMMVVIDPLESPSMDSLPGQAEHLGVEE